MINKIVLATCRCDDDDDGDGNAVYSVSGSTSTEPIETHPNFIGMAGNPLKAPWKNGAEFIKSGQKDAGKFLGFRTKEEDGSLVVNKKSGVKNYLEGGMIFRQVKTYSSASSGSSLRANMKNLGYIDTPPNVSDFVDIDSGRDWLLITCNIEEVGDGLTVTMEWRLSGRNGWDIDIYTKTGGSE